MLVDVLHRIDLLVNGRLLMHKLGFLCVARVFLSSLRRDWVGSHRFERFLLATARLHILSGLISSRLALAQDSRSLDRHAF